MKNKALCRTRNTSVGRISIDFRNVGAMMNFSHRPITVAEKKGYYFRDQFINAIENIDDIRRDLLTKKSKIIAVQMIPRHCRGLTDQRFETL